MIKVASNSVTANHMDEDMDINAGTVADGEEDIATLGRRMYDTLLEVASGRKTCSETLGLRELMTWRIGPDPLNRGVRCAVSAGNRYDIS